MPSLQNPATIAVLFGLAFGVLLGALAFHRVTRRIADNSGGPGWVLVMSTLLVLVGAIPSCLIAFVIGGNLGITLGSLSIHSTTGELVGMSLGIGLVLSACVAACSAIGSGLGAVLASIMRDGHAHTVRQQQRSPLFRLLHRAGSRGGQGLRVRGGR